MMLITRPHLSNLGAPHSHILIRTNIIRDAFSVRLAIPMLTTPTSLAIPLITVHEQHLLGQSSYISFRARFSLPFYKPFSPTSVISSPLHLLNSDVNCQLTIRFLAHRSAKFDVHPQVHFMMTVRDRIFPSMNAANGPPLAVVLFPICTSN